MPEHVLMANVEIITDGGHRRHWSALEAEILHEALEKSRIKKPILLVRPPLKGDFQRRRWQRRWVWPART